MYFDSECEEVEAMGCLEWEDEVECESRTEADEEATVTDDEEEEEEEADAWGEPSVGCSTEDDAG